MIIRPKGGVTKNFFPTRETGEETQQTRGEFQTTRRNKKTQGTVRTSKARKRACCEGRTLGK